MTARDYNDDEARRLFERLTTRFLAGPSVTEGRMFGSAGLKVGSKVFAMLVKGQLVVKLPKKRVDQLVASGTGTPFDPGHGRLMKEWVSIAAAHGRDWEQFASEALEFVGSAVLSPRRR